MPNTEVIVADTHRDLYNHLQRHIVIYPRSGPQQAPDTLHGHDLPPEEPSRIAAIRIAADACVFAPRRLTDW
ncbi:hypothetical protein AB0J72_18485 [Dactylosporangium sp. NPDC049742]|uniref:hypothetical protein n=1 Tax=Dactylosporangium sp. NPDC049742 TaxID=3154737 RepID=UPI0034188D98